MARKSWALALHLLRTVYNATDRPMQCRSLEGLDVPETAEARRYAVERGWILVRDGHSVCLTEAGRRLMDQ
jgi:RNA:NAD 2'-phosphotransferase (TPT1/KptA family)